MSLGGLNDPGKAKLRSLLEVNKPVIASAKRPPLIFRREDVTMNTDPSALVAKYDEAMLIEIGAGSVADLVTVVTATGDRLVLAPGRPSPIGPHRGPFQIEIGTGDWNTGPPTGRNYFARPTNEVRRRYPVLLELYFWQESLPGAIATQRAPLLYQLPVAGGDSLVPTVAVERICEFPCYGRRFHILHLFANDQDVTYNIKGVKEAAASSAFEFQLYPAAGNATLTADTWISLVFENEFYDRIQLNAGQVAGGDFRYFFETRDNA